MKLFIASDIHGSAYWCEKMRKAFEESGADTALLLGDLLYHGPRNDLPEGYAPKKVIAMLCGVAEKLLCVRGNCEAEVDQMVLNFPVMADYALISDENVRIYATHGHIWNADKPLPASRGSVLLCGHTHVPRIYECEGGAIYMNPGSVSIPKEGSPHSYMIYENGGFYWYDLAGTGLYMEKHL